MKTALSSRNETIREVYLCNLSNGQMEDRMFGGLLDHKSGEHLLRPLGDWERKGGKIQKETGGKSFSIRSSAMQMPRIIGKGTVSSFQEL